VLLRPRPCVNNAMFLGLLGYKARDNPEDLAQLLGINTGGGGGD